MDNEAALTNRIADLDLLCADLDDLAARARDCREAMIRIALPAGEQDGRRPHDPDTRADMADERRSAIFEAWTDEFNFLLERRPPPPADPSTYERPLAVPDEAEQPS